MRNWIVGAGIFMVSGMVGCDRSTPPGRPSLT